jgi:hypothetical protein
VHGRGSLGFGQQVHLRPLSIPDPGWMLISRAGASSGGPPGVTALGLLPGSDHLNYQYAGGHDQAGAAWRAHRTPRWWGPPDKVWGRTTPPTPG